MDGQGSAAAQEANERLYAMRAALAARRAAGGALEFTSHSEAATPDWATPDTCCLGSASGEAQGAARLSGVAAALAPVTPAGAGRGHPIIPSHSQMLSDLSSLQATLLDRHLTEPRSAAATPPPAAPPPAPRRRGETRRCQAKRVQTRCRSRAGRRAFKRTVDASGGFQPAGAGRERGASDK